MAEIACPSCGTSNPETARFCGSCGEPLERTCPSCGTANPLANRFCGSCGTALVPVQERPSQRAASLEERKVVTMLFADLTASTEMSSRLDPEDLRSVLRPFFDAMADEIGRYGGTVEKFIGDAVVAAFGAPVAHEDDPERAIRCGLAMQRRLAELNTEVAELAGSDLAMRIGINTGEVLAHSIEEGIVTGEAVNIAARLQSLARPGRVVVGERTYRDAREAFAFADLGDVSVKGIDRPLRVYEVEREAAGTDEGRERATAPLVGRDPEMELLRLQFRRTVAQSNPNLITIVGPPGIGKSRLCDEAARAFEDEGARVVRGRCLPYGDGLTYWPLAEILRADAGILDSDPAEETIAKARERLDPRFPGEEGLGVASVLLSSIGVELATDPLAGAEREAAQRLIARSWQRYLESLAEGAPLVALIDDVHWADPSLLELLESVVARASGPILVLCMARPDLFERRARVGRRALERDDDLPVRALARRRLAADRAPPGRSRAPRGGRPDPSSIRGEPVLRHRAAPDDDRGLDDRPPRRPLGARPGAALAAARHRAGCHRVAHRPAGARGEARDPGRVGDRAELLAGRGRPPDVGERRARDRGIGRQGSGRRTRHVDDRARTRVPVQPRPHP